MPHATAEIGRSLREAREELGISVEEAAWRTRIRPEFLRALEDERFGDLGHLAVARRHLHSYARHLGLDADALAARYAERFERAEPSPIERLNERARKARRPPRPKWLAAALVSAAVLVTAGLTGIVRGPGPRTAPVDELEILPAPALEQPPAASPAGPPAPAGVTLGIVTTARVWIRAVADGAVAFEGALPAGASRTFSAAERVDLVIGNAGAVRLTLNGRPLGAPGRAGEVFRGSFGPRGRIGPQ